MEYYLKKKLLMKFLNCQKRDSKIGRKLFDDGSIHIIDMCIFIILISWKVVVRLEFKQKGFSRKIDLHLTFYDLLGQRPFCSHNE